MTGSASLKVEVTSVSDTMGTLSSTDTNVFTISNTCVAPTVSSSVANYNLIVPSASGGGQTTVVDASGFFTPSS